MRRCVFLVLLAACLSPVAPGDAKQYDPPAIYRTWWTEMEACVNANANFDAVRYYSLDIACLPAPAEEAGCRLGEYRPGANAITVALHAKLLESILKHEMAHALGIEHGELLDACAPLPGVIIILP